MSKAIHTLTSSKNDNWCTPYKVLEPLYRLAPIGLDPCADLGSAVEARQKWFYASHGCSLPKPWAPQITAQEQIFVNPPYGRALAAWTDKVAKESASGKTLTLLVPSRTGVRWWATAYNACNALCFWRGRLAFTLGDSTSEPAPFDVTLFYFGQNARLFREIFAEYGIVFGG